MKKKNKIIISCLLIVLSVTLFVSATYAWFTDTAVVNGNKIFAGNLYVDVVADFDALKGVGLVTGNEGNYVVDADGNITLDNESKVPYKEKTYTDGTTDTTKKYYVMSDVEAPYITLYNVEPGQAFPFKVGIMNSGDLAVKYTAGFNISEDEDGHLRSYTGIETLEKQHIGDFDTYHNKNLVNDGSITNNRDYELNQSLEDDEAYTERLNRLKKKQWDETKPEGSQDIGGHLEDVLEVYAVDKDSIDPTTGSPTRKAIQESNLIGTVKQIINANDMSYTPATEEESEQLEIVRQRIFEKAEGYLLPTETIEDENGKQLIDGVTVDIVEYDDEGLLYLDNKYHVSDIGEVQYVLYMPEDVDNLYQNASLFLDMGVTGTQVEFEIDGLNCMIYDTSVEYSRVINPGPHTMKFILSDPDSDHGFHEYEATFDAGILNQNYRNITLRNTDGQHADHTMDMLLLPFGSKSLAYFLKDKETDNLFYLCTDEATVIDPSINYVEDFANHTSEVYTELNAFGQGQYEAEWKMIPDQLDGNPQTAEEIYNAIYSYMLYDSLYNEMPTGNYHAPAVEIFTAYSKAYDYTPLKMYDFSKVEGVPTYYCFHVTPDLIN